MSADSNWDGGAPCPDCNGTMQRHGVHVRCTNCAYGEGAVSYANRLEELRRQWHPAPTTKPSRRSPKKRQTKADKVRERLNHPSLFGSVVRPGSGYREAESRANSRGNPAPMPLTRIVKLEHRCGTCDRILRVMGDLFVCPKCAEIHTTNAAVRMIEQAFPGTKLVDE